MLDRLQSAAPSPQRWHELREKPSRPEFVEHQFKHYIRAYGWRALLIATNGVQAFIDSARDPKVAMSGLRSQYGVGLRLHRLWWGPPDGIIALHLAWSATSGRLDATVHGLVESARDHEITLTPDHVARARACDLIERVDLEVEHLRCTGQMSELDQDFTTERQRQPLLQYDRFLRKLKTRLLYAIVRECKDPVAQPVVVLTEPATLAFPPSLQGEKHHDEAVLWEEPALEFPKWLRRSNAGRPQ
jgi:hypothetical protein